MRYVLLALVIASAAVVARLRGRQRDVLVVAGEPDDYLAVIQTDVRRYDASYPIGGM